MAHPKPQVNISTSFSYETLEETLDVKPKGTQLHIGIPKETAFQENRIALTPDAVGVLVSNGHKVVIEHNAGEPTHFKDKDYSEAGAQIVCEIRAGSRRGPSVPPNESADIFSHSYVGNEGFTAGKDDGKEDNGSFFRGIKR
jgi:hypothetical protein